MKLVNIEVIKDELERLIRNYRFYSSTEAKYKYEAYKELSEWLDEIEVEEVEERTQHHIPMEDIENAAARYDGSMDCVGCFIGGAKWMEKQIMKDAIEREVKEDAGGYPYIDATELYDYENDKPLAKAGDKVKVVFIKEK